MIRNFLTVAQQVAILFVLMGLGAAMRKAKFFEGAAIDGIVNVLLLVVTPCLIVTVFQRPFESSMLMGLGLTFAIAVLVHLVLIGVSGLLVRPRDPDVRRPLLLSAVFSNAGFVGIPLEQAVLGDDGVFYGIVYIIVFHFFIWSWGLKTMKKGEEGGSGRGFPLKAVVNPGTVGIALGLPLFFLSVKLPPVVSEPLRHMSNLNTPLAMIVIGYGLAGMRLGKVVRQAAVYLATFVRLIVSPLLMVAVLYPFRQSLDRNMMLALTVAASAPVAAMVPMFAAKYRRDVDVSVGVVSGTTILSVLTMPVVIALAMAVL